MVQCFVISRTSNVKITYFYKFPIFNLYIIIFSGNKAHLGLTSISLLHLYGSSRQNSFYGNSAPKYRIIPMIFAGKLEQFPFTDSAKNLWVTRNRCTTGSHDKIRSPNCPPRAAQYPPKWHCSLHNITEGLKKSVNHKIWNKTHTAPLGDHTL